mgnify:CR=1 FL=1
MQRLAGRTLLRISLLQVSHKIYFTGLLTSH